MTLDDAEPGQQVRIYEGSDVYLVIEEVDYEGNTLQKRLVHLAEGIMLNRTALDRVLIPVGEIKRPRFPDGE